MTDGNLVTTDTARLRVWLDAMLRLQRGHNEKVHPQWDAQGYPFTRAIWIECAELMDHYGWKWWKHQSADLDQVKLELVDIWHFGLSALMIEHKVAVADAVCATIREAEENPKQLEFLQAVEALAAEALHGTFSIPAFVDAMQALPMSFEQLYAIYVAKNVLNVFRQANGYKDGSYRKQWLGREDNEHLAELAQTLNVASESYIEDLERLLSERYAEVLASPA